MKKLLILVLVLVTVAFTANAHPASKVNLTYKDGKLKVEAIHHVSDVTTHYINQMVVTVDSVEVKTMDFITQSSLEAQTVELVIPEIKMGSKVSVKARCNRFGKKTGELTVE